MFYGRRTVVLGRQGLVFLSQPVDTHSLGGYKLKVQSHGLKSLEDGGRIPSEY